MNVFLLDLRSNWKQKIPDNGINNKTCSMLFEVLEWSHRIHQLFMSMKTAKPSLWTYLLCCMMLSVTCFSNISLLRAWLTNGIESLICPLLFFIVWLLIFFLSFFFYDLNDTPHRKKETMGSQYRGWGRRWDGWMTFWPFFEVTPTTQLENVVQMSHSENCIKALL